MIYKYSVGIISMVFDVGLKISTTYGWKIFRIDALELLVTNALYVEDTDKKMHNYVRTVP